MIFFAAFLAILAAGLFSAQTDDPRRNFIVKRGESFYIQVRKNKETDENKGKIKMKYAADVLLYFIKITIAIGL